jgi:23S rRNA (uracil1939-C5)-methyltransferase
MTLCRHFGVCGGCALQDMPPDVYRRHKQGLVEKALVRAGLGQAIVNGPVLSPGKSRRRAVFKFGKVKGQVVAGFHAARSHVIVDMQECLVLTPALLDFAALLRRALAPILADGEKAEVHASETDTGLDLAFRWPRKLTPALTAEMAKAFAGADVARIVYNGEILLERAKPEIHFDGIGVTPPPHAFLQATGEGEAALRAQVAAATKGAKAIVDMFAGLGTFALPLARRAKVHAVEQDGGALATLADAARRTPGLKPVTTEKRDLFKTPLTVLELNRFDAAVLDPPRAGAEAQVKLLGVSKIRRVAYVSCDAASFARDAAILVKTGFAMGDVTPVDQFLYSDHIELVAGFTKL